MKNQPDIASHPLLIGLRAARVNLVPGLIVQAVMIAVVLGYYFYPPARAWLSQLADLKERWGYGFGLVSGAIAGGVLPEILAVAVFQKGRPTRANWDRLVFNTLYWASQGLMVDAFYRFQGVLFGTEAGVATVIKKVMVDQFLYTPFIAMPLAMTCFEWRNNGYSFKGLGRVMSKAFYKDTVLPATIAAWGVWIPVVCMVYSLPSLLQVPLFSLALTFWSMQLTWISRKKS